MADGGSCKAGAVRKKFEVNTATWKGISWMHGGRSGSEMQRSWRKLSIFRKRTRPEETRNPLEVLGVWSR